MDTHDCEQLPPSDQDVASTEAYTFMKHYTVGTENPFLSTQYTLKTSISMCKYIIIMMMMIMIMIIIIIILIYIYIFYYNTPITAQASPLPTSK